MNQLQLQFEKYIYKIIRNIPNANKQVLQFIMKFTSHAATTEDEYEIIRMTFRSGYCWHFAHMLKTTFNRGEVCWAAPFGHFVWLDNNQIPYDMEGVYEGECIYFIPESYLGDALKDFTHIPGIIHSASIEMAQNIIHKYETDNHLPNQDAEICKLLRP